MCYEAGHAPLAVGSIDNFLFELAVHPSTLQLVRAPPASWPANRGVCSP
jgi:hypothetical protein